MLFRTTINRLIPKFIWLFETWWIWGIAGWVLVILNYPYADILPVYAE